jgi:translocation and assembly module TamB
MLTNSFLLTTSLGAPGEGSLTSTRNQLAFTSLSQLVSSQLNRYLNYALPNLDVSVGFLGESAQDLDVTYGVALSLLDERLVIRGQGLYQNESSQNAQHNLLDEFVVEVRLSNTVSVEVFYRREGDILGADQTLANTTGAGLSYETQFTTWSRLMERLFGWMRRSDPMNRTADVFAVDSSAASDDNEPCFTRQVLYREQITRPRAHSQGSPVPASQQRTQDVSPEGDRERPWLP